MNDFADADLPDANDTIESMMLVQEAADYCKAPRSTIYSAVKRGLLSPAFRVGPTMLFLPADLDAYMAKTRGTDEAGKPLPARVGRPRKKTEAVAK